HPSQLIERAQTDGPQTITRDGEAVADVLSVEDHRRLTARDESLVSFLRGSPLVGLDLDVGSRNIPDRRAES
ncbi:MAG: type II toxin-antitoxin system prevent-host-death family antitoxin, partial [Candidatus Latescibacteria bacterium]|nr:type II toxin-antitoxin system prevent-host-death family antitoxin [Candidatus Latescibacterota bacterium]